LGNFNTDQAEGLRRMLAGPKPRIVSLLSALSIEEKSATLVNLAASLTRAGSDVLLFDACSASNGLAQRLGVARVATLMQVARQERGLNEVIQKTAQGFGVGTMTRESMHGMLEDVDQARRLSNAFSVLATQSDIVLVDAELSAEDGFPVQAMAAGEIVVQVSGSSSAITSAYALIKRLNSQLGRRPFGLLVSGATDVEAQRIYENIERTARRYLAVELQLIGTVPVDADLRRAVQLGRPVVDAFPMAGAAIAFRRMAGHLLGVESDSRQMPQPA
jgi:flagellar biosynthesis protein FlhG